MNGTALKLISGVAAILVVFIFAETGSSQRAPRREARGRAMTKAQVKAVITRVEDRVDRFIKRYDEALDRSGLDKSNREDWLMKRARDLETATDELAREFDRHDAWVENKEETRNCLNIATDIDRNMRRFNYTREAEQNWANVRFELNTLADIYNLPRVGAGVYK
jgi:hypothetical protein